MFCRRAERIETIADIDSAIEKAKLRVRNKTHSGRYIAYFQAYTNTYGDFDRLEAIYREFVILGLPGETKDMRVTVAWLSALEPPLDGIKLSLMHVLRGTELARQWENGTADLYDFTPEEYAAFVAELVNLLPQETVVHRMTGDGDKRELLYPLWSADKKRVLNLLQNELRNILN